MKHEWRKKEKSIYIPKQQPELIDIPEYKYITITGKGNPNSKEFADKIGVLYPLSYGIRMMPKSGFTPEGYFEYTVYPLEGLWDISDEAKKSGVFDKNELVYKIMIRQPDFVTEDIFKKAYDKVVNKKSIPYIEEAKFESIKDGQSVQMLHLGSYDNEGETFSIMKNFIKEQGLSIKTLVHREIYLSDFRKVAPEKLKTTLRYQVE